MNLKMLDKFATFLEKRKKAAETVSAIAGFNSMIARTRNLKEHLNSFMGTPEWKEFMAETARKPRKKVKDAKG